MTDRKDPPMADHNRPDPVDQTLPQILAALRSIAAAVNHGTEVLVNPADDRTPSQEQSTTIVDYLVLRELVGRQADEKRRTVAATRFPDGLVVFDGDIPETARTVAVFTRRVAAPDEVTGITDDSVIVDRLREHHRGSGSGAGGTVLGFVLSTVTDDQPIVRLELRRDDDLAVALGPRLAPVA
jgi:hypothetical protein